MSDSNSNGSDTRVNISDYDDFYDLLGLDYGASEDVVLRRSRKLLAEYHPDVSDHSNADAVFKKVNRAQEVLTDEKQREIYELLGHDEYIERREEDGEMTLSEDVTSNDDTIFEGLKRRDKKHKKGATNIPGTDRDTVSNPGSKSDSAEENSDSVTDGSQQSSHEDRGTITDKIRNRGSYQSIAEFNMGLSPRESVKKIYNNVWIARFALIMMFASAIIYTNLTDPAAILDVWSSTSAFDGYSVVSLSLVSIVLFTLLITTGSGVVALKLLQTTEEEITIESKEQKEREKREREQSRGLNTSISTSRSQQTRQRDAWDSENGFNTVIETSEADETSTSLTHGSKLLFAGVLITAFGSVMDGIHPWEYLQKLVSGHGTETDLWWAVGNEGLQEVAVLINAGIAFVMFILVISGVILTTYGLSRDVWYSRYFTNKNPLPVVWDAAIAVCTTVVAFGILSGSAEVNALPIAEFPSQILILIGATETVTAMSLGIFAAILLLVLVFAFRFRKRF